jgi:hypothetical protein
VAKDFFEQSLRSSQPANELANQLAATASKPRGGTLAFSQDAPISAPLQQNAPIDPWRYEEQPKGGDDEEPLPDARPSDFLPFAASGGGGGGGGGNDHKNIGREINKSLDLDHSKGLNHTRETIRILQEGGVGMGVPLVAQLHHQKGPWRARPRPEWERPWNIHDRNKKKTENESDPHQHQQYGDEDDEEGDNGDGGAAISKDDKLSRSKFAHYIHSWDAPLSASIQVEEEVEEEEDDEDGDDNERTMHSPQRRRRHGIQNKHNYIPPPPLDENARFSQPTEAWVIRQQESNGNPHHNHTVEASHVTSNHHHPHLVAKRPLGGGAPSFGLPYGGSHNPSSHNPRQRSSPSRKGVRHYEEKNLTPTSPEESAPLQDMRALHSQQSQLHQQQQQLHHHQQQHQQQQLHHQQQHHQQQQLHHQQGVRRQQTVFQNHDSNKSYQYMAKDASTEIGYDNQSSPNNHQMNPQQGGGEGEGGSVRGRPTVVISSRNPHVETKTRSTSPFDETVLRQVYPHHIQQHLTSWKSPAAAAAVASSSFSTKRQQSQAQEFSPLNSPPSFHTRRKQANNKSSHQRPHQTHHQRPSEMKKEEETASITQQQLSEMFSGGGTDLNVLVSAMSGLMSGASAMMQEYRGWGT